MLFNDSVNDLSSFAIRPRKYEYVALVEWHWQRELVLELSGQELLAVPYYPSRIAHAFAWERILLSKLQGRQVRSGNMAEQIVVAITVVHSFNLFVK